MIACQKIVKSPFIIRFKNGLCHLDPIFMPFSKWGVTFLCYKNWRSYLTICKFSSIWYWFHKNSSGDHIHAPIFKNRVSFFPQGTKLSAEMVFRANSYGQDTLKCRKVPNFGYFFTSVVKLPSNTKWPWTGFSPCPILIRF